MGTSATWGNVKARVPGARFARKARFEVRCNTRRQGSRAPAPLASQGAVSSFDGDDRPQP